MLVGKVNGFRFREISQLKILLILWLVEGDDDLDSVKSYSTHGPMMPLVELQPAFQPTSTPAHLQRRFMASAPRIPLSNLRVFL